jgi:hypothetical protein
VGVSVRPDRASRILEAQVDLMLLEQGAMIVTCKSNDVPDVEHLAVELHLAPRDASDVEQFVDELAEVLSLTEEDALGPFCLFAAA